MAKLGFVTMVLSIFAVIGVASLSSHDASAVAGCKRTEFKTKLVKDACAQGGQKAAKDAMKKFLKDNKSKMAGLDCGTCHAKLAPAYPLKPDGLKTFTTLGGELLGK